MEQYPRFFVFDTSVFTNNDSYRFFGRKPTEAYRTFLTKLEVLNKTRKQEGYYPLIFYITPGVARELQFCVDNKLIDNRLLAQIQQRVPNINATLLSANLFLDMIEETRERGKRALKIGEKFVIRALNERKPNQPLRKREQQQFQGTFLTKLREDFRQATRHGVLDSKEDLELLLLAKELDASLVTSDQGMEYWARKIGGITVLPFQFLSSLVSSH